jgi:radical SAM protein
VRVPDVAIPRRPDFARRPILVFWEVTRACPLACRHCRADAIHDPLPGELSTAEGRALIASLGDFDGRPPILVLTGGDPLSRPDLFTLLAEARDQGVTVALSPAVSDHLDDATIARLRDAGVTSMSISLDGAVPATHEQMRGVDGHHAATLDAIDRLVAAGVHVQVNTTVTAANAVELPPLLAQLLAHGVGVWEVFFLIQVGRGTGVAELSPAGVTDVCEFLVDAARHVTVRTVEAPVFRRVVVERGDRDRPARPGPLYQRLRADLDTLVPAASGPSRAQTAGTRDGKGIVFVGYDGTVTPAGFLPVTLGSVREQPLAEIYRDHPLLHDIRAARFAGRCGRCGYADLCGGSRARAWAASRDPLAEDPACDHEPSVVDLAVTR